MRMNFLSLSFLLTCFITVNCVEYHISSRCPDPTENSCLTLSQLAENISYYLDFETTFILDHGRHVLNSELLIENSTKVFINGSSYSFDVTIYCEDSGRLSFDFVNDVYISGLRYLNCGCHQVRFVNRFVLMNSVFENHKETAVKFIKSSAIITNSSFNLNSNISPQGVGQHHVGAAMIFTESNVTIEKSSFEENYAEFGGVMFAKLYSNITIVESVFVHNKADKGGVIFSQSSYVTINASTFRKNSAIYFGAVLHLDMRSTVRANDVILDSNKADQGIVFLVESTCVFTGSTEVSNNIGSLLLFYSNATLSGNIFFTKNTVNISTHFAEGGAITAIRSNLFLEGKSNLMYNKAEHGGAIHALVSRVNVYGCTTVSNNNATGSGGGIYLFLSELKCENKCALHLLGNTAEKGGGIYAVTSLVTAVYGSQVEFVGNTARKDGGGIYLEVSAKLNTLIIRETTRLIPDDQYRLITFTENSADHNGGAIYVADETYFGTCNTTRIHSTASECFLQSIILSTEAELDNVMSGDHSKDSVKFKNNYAQNKGSNLYGGLLDRCTLSPFTRTRSSLFGVKNSGIPYFEYLSNSSDLDSISSDAVRVCFCKNNQLNCSYQPCPFRVKKGETFNVSLATVDQAYHPLSFEVYSFLLPHHGKVESKNTKTGNYCTDVSFNVVSPEDHVKLIIYANGPCKDAKISQATIEIYFSNCTCPIGFEQNVKIKEKCVCECDTNLTKYIDISECNNQTQTLVRSTNSWISYVNSSVNGFSGYLIHRYCPLNYCTTQTSIPINLSISNGSDAQCDLHRSGILCGTCEAEFSISLGSSNCIYCPSYWPASLIGISILFLLAGVALVGFLLVLNITVAVGTLNGIIFYVNIIDANSSTFLHFSTPNYVTVFISWLNLDFGFDVCFIKGLDSYQKTWLQLAFPTYVIFLVVMVIIISRWSKKFSQLIGRKNPVATLATLIFLSYAKFLKIIITGLSCTTLTYSRIDGEQYDPPYVWLSEATLTCYRGRHVILFITAVFILVACIIYTILLFSWQWLLSLHNKFFSRWTCAWTLKLSTFIETPHTPYNPQNRYWTGLLLIVRVIVYFASTANVTKNPSIDLLVIGVVMIAIILLQQIVSVRCRVYKKWPLEILEVSCILNLMVFSFATLYALDNNKTRCSIAYTSVSITICLFLGVLFYHFFTEFISKTKVYVTIKEHIASLKHNGKRLEEECGTELIETHTRTTSVLTRSESGDHEFFYYNLDAKSTY